MPTPSTESSSSRRNPDLHSSSTPTATATASHPPASKPDPTENADNAKGRFSSSSASGAAELARLQVRLRAALRQFPDFPTPGVLFEDILPIFQNPGLHDSLLRALDIHIDQAYGDTQKPDVIVGLEARGFLFGPSLALRLGAAFVPVRKKGKLPGPIETAGYQKEYGQDFFQIQQDGIKPGQRVLIVDDIIATGEMMTPKLPPTLIKYHGKTILTSFFLQVARHLRQDRSSKNLEARFSVTFSSSNSSSSRAEKSSMLRYTHS